MNLQSVATFMAKSGMRKIGAGLVMFVGLVFLGATKALAGPEFVECFKVLVLGVFAGNAAEHFAKRGPANAAPAPAAPQA